MLVTIEPSPIIRNRKHRHSIYLHDYPLLSKPSDGNNVAFTYWYAGLKTRHAHTDEWTVRG